MWAVPGAPDIGRLSQENRLSPVCGQHPALSLGGGSLVGRMDA